MFKRDNFFSILNVIFFLKEDYPKLIYFKESRKEELKMYYVFNDCCNNFY